MPRIKIAYLAFSEEYGAEHAGFTHSFNVVTALSRLNLQVISFFRSKTNLNFPNIYGVCFPSLKNFFKTNPLFYIKSYFMVRKNLQYVDLIHERFHVNPIELLFIRDKPYILEINDPAMVLHNNFFYKFLINLKLKKCDAIITQTYTLKNILSRYTNKPIYVVANGVDINEFKPNIKNNIRKKYGLKNSDIVVIFVGAFMQWHGVMDIVKLAKIFSNVKFILVGNGPEFDSLNNYSKGLQNIILTGSQPRENIPKFLAAADIAIAPFNTSKFTKLERYGFWWCPIKLFEYMESGKPIVSYNYTEINNIVKGGAFLAQPGNFKEFAEKLNLLVLNRKLRKKLGYNSRKIVSGYSWDSRAKEIHNIYLSLKPKPKF